MSQIDKIKQILVRDGRIDNFSTISKKLSLRLGARIYDLKHRGWKFDRYFTGNKKRNCVYVVRKYAN